MELKPCPFCGGEATILEGEDPVWEARQSKIIKMKTIAEIRCESCHIGQRIRRNKADAIEAWNKRIGEE